MFSFRRLFVSAFGRGQWVTAKDAGLVHQQLGASARALSSFASSRPAMTTLFASACRRASSSAIALDRARPHTAGAAGRIVVIAVGHLSLSDVSGPGRRKRGVEFQSRLDFREGADRDRGA
jgi:hypothetical protein